MQTSEYLQLGFVAVGLAIITWVKMSYMRRAQVDQTVNAFSPRERHARMLAFGLIAVAFIFVFFPF